MRRLFSHRSHPLLTFILKCAAVEVDPCAASLGGSGLPGRSHAVSWFTFSPPHPSLLSRASRMLCSCCSMCRFCASPEAPPPPDRPLPAAWAHVLFPPLPPPPLPLPPCWACCWPEGPCWLPPPLPPPCMFCWPAEDPGCCPGPPLCWVGLRLLPWAGEVLGAPPPRLGPPPHWPWELDWPPPEPPQLAVWVAEPPQPLAALSPPPASPRPRGMPHWFTRTAPRGKEAKPNFPGWPAARGMDEVGNEAYWLQVALGWVRPGLAWPGSRLKLGLLPWRWPVAEVVAIEPGMLRLACAGECASAAAGGAAPGAPGTVVEDGRLGPGSRGCSPPAGRQPSGTELNITDKDLVGQQGIKGSAPAPRAPPLPTGDSSGAASPPLAACPPPPPPPPPLPLLLLLLLLWSVTPSLCASHTMPTVSTA